MTLFVTAILDLREDRSKDRSVDTRFAHFARLVSTGIRLCVFYSSTYRDRIQAICDLHANVQAIPCELEDLWLYKQLAPHTVALPATRTEHHDTRNFLILMNSKLDLVQAALDLHPTVSHVAWIDFNVWHVIKDHANTMNRLQMMARSTLKETFLAIPGCWSRGYQDSALFSCVNWRFCGGFFIGDRRSIQGFIDLYRAHAMTAFYEEGVGHRLTWEVNLWTWLEAYHGFNPQWFKGDHDDSLVGLPGRHLSVVASLTTIPSRIGTSCVDAIQSLLRQVDHVYLSVSSSYERFADPLVIPAVLLNEPKVTIVLAKDRGPLTKYVGALDHLDPGQWIFICDDDQVYAPTLIERMMGSVTALCAYQNHYESICAKTSGGIVHGYVGHLTHRSFLEALRTFPVLPCAKNIDDQVMSLYYFFRSIQIRPTGIERYEDLFARLENGHEQVGAPHSLSGFGHEMRNIQVRSTERIVRAHFTKDCGQVTRLLQNEPTAVTGTYAFPRIEGYEPTSSSFLLFSGTPLLNVRYVNYSLTPEGVYIIQDSHSWLRTQNILLTLDETLNAIQRHKLMIVSTPLPQTCVGIHGLEDIRMYEHKGRLRFIATQRQYSPTRQNRMVTGDVSQSISMLTNIAVLEPPTPTDCEKNWIPVSHKGQEWFIYKWHPFQAGPIVDGCLRIDVEHATSPIFERIRGSTPFLENGPTTWIGVVHYSFDPAPRRYYHRLVVLDRETLRPIQVSQSFVFGRVGIEFCLGFTVLEEEGRYRFWYSQHDRDPAWLSVAKEAFVMTPC